MQKNKLVMRDTRSMSPSERKTDYETVDRYSMDVGGLLYLDIERDPFSINVINVRYHFLVVRHHFSPFTICFDLGSVICSTNMFIVAYHPLDDHSSLMCLVDLCSFVFATHDILINRPTRQQLNYKAIILPQFRFIVRLSWPQYNMWGYKLMLPLFTTRVIYIS